MIGAHICTNEYFDGFMDTVRLFADERGCVDNYD